MNNRLTTENEVALAGSAGLSDHPEERRAEGPDNASYDVPMTRLQRAVARRMTAAKAEIPEFVTEVDVDMVAVARLREACKRRGGLVPSYNDFVVRACARGLRDVPQVNASFSEDRFTLHRRINIGVAVAASGMLVVPTIFDADRMSLEQIAERTSELAAKVRDGSIRAGELAAGTFTVSNLGMFGVRKFVAVINPPQAAILAVGEVSDRVVARHGKPDVRTQMTVALSADHRVVYGTDAAEFLASVREGLEAPEELTGEPTEPRVSTDEKGWEM
jgi:pyruvate dehydrogenase E2 component (dihydrolipoyllysine-residue acetyltransferase)